MRVFALICFIWLGSLGSVTSWADSRTEAQNSNWLLFEQGNAAANRKEYGQALQLYKRALEASSYFPEAEEAIGDVYAEEGEVGLALKQYEKAYENRGSLYVADEQYQLLEKMANLYEQQQMYRKMEDALLKVVVTDSRFIDTATSRLRTQVEKNFYDQGIEKVLILYDFGKSVSGAAHARLGVFYYLTGLYSQAVAHLLYAVLDRSSSIEAFLRDRDVEHQFASLQEQLASITSSTELSDFARQVDYYKMLYYLAASTFAAGYPKNAAFIWNLLSSISQAAGYQDLSKRQIKAPWVDPVIRLGR